MRFVQLQDWLQWIEAQHPREIDLGLERVAAVVAKMNLSLAMPVITVAGTNGKGSCVALLSAVLSAAGYRVGAYTSPHLLRYNERVVIDGQQVSDAALVAAFDRVDRVRGDTSLSYFEFGTLAALQLFSDAQPDVLVLEVGLGGRLDAVNVVDADIAIISSVDLDHEAWLGSDREAIAKEKAGIARRGRPLVFGDPRRCEAVLTLAEALQLPLYQRGVDFDFVREAQCWDWRGRSDAGGDAHLAALPPPAVMLDNAATVIQAVQLLSLPVDEGAIRQGLTAVRIAARGEYLQLREHGLLLDVAHNPAALAHLSEQLAELPPTGKVVAVFAVMADKHVADSLAALIARIDHWYLPPLPGVPRAMAPGVLREHLLAAGAAETAVSQPSELAESLAAIRAELKADDCLVVFGSFFTVAAAMQAMPATAFVESLH